MLTCGALLTGSPIAFGAAEAQRVSTPVAEPIYLVIRSDDAGMSHSVNMALERLIKSGLPVSISVMFPTPWHQETIEILKRYPDVSVGIHLTLTSEWRNYRWGPILGRTAVPTLVDSNGYFPPSAADVHQRADINEVERELRAQIDRALRSGLKIDYLDYHMGTVLGRPDMVELTERLAKEYNLGLSGYFGEDPDGPQYSAAPDRKIDSLETMLATLKPGVRAVVTHVGIDDSELGALLDMNTSGPLPDMSRNRQGELNALTSQRFKDAVKAHHVQVITYRQLIQMQGLKAMKRPQRPVG